MRRVTNLTRDGSSREKGREYSVEFTVEEFLREGLEDWITQVGEKQFNEIKKIT